MSKYSPEYLTSMKRDPVTLNFIKKAIKRGYILEQKVVSCTEDNTLILDLGNSIIAKIPFDELEYHYDGSETKVAAATSKINKHLKFLPKSVEKENDKYVVMCSRKDVQELCFKEFIKNLKVGDIIDAKIIKVYDYGTFCDIGCGITALLPTNCISVTHVVNPKESLRYVPRLKVIVSSIDENYRIQLSHKELLGTWEENSSKFNIGDIVKGTILSVEEYGVFVRLSQNLSGLAELPDDLDLQTGDNVSVKITNIKPDSMKIKLLIIDKLEKERDETLKFTYMVNESHIKDWVYSTPNSERVIESHF